MLAQFSGYFIVFAVVFSIRNIAEVLIVPKPKNKGSGQVTLLLFVILYFTAGLSVGFYILADSIINPYLFWFGILIFLLFFLLRIIAIKKMGSTYSQLIQPNNDAKLITTGFYKKIRHPLYSFYFLEMMGLLLIKFNYIALSAVIIDLIVTLFRIKTEEKLLIEKYGDDYKNYKTKTWKLIPFIC